MKTQKLNQDLVGVLEVDEQGFWRFSSFFHCSTHCSFVICVIISSNMRFSNVHLCFLMQEKPVFPVWDWMECDHLEDNFCCGSCLLCSLDVSRYFQKLILLISHRFTRIFFFLSQLAAESFSLSGDLRVFVKSTMDMWPWMTLLQLRCTNTWSKSIS